MVVAAVPMTVLMGTGILAVAISVIVHSCTPRRPTDTRYKPIDRLEPLLELSMHDVQGLGAGEYTVIVNEDALTTFVIQ